MVSLTFVSCISYIISLSCQAVQLLKYRTGLHYAFKLTSLLSVLGHGYLLYRLIETPGGQNLDGFILLSMMFWLLNISILLFSNLSKIENLALFAYPITIVALALGAVYAHHDIVETKDYPGMVGHILISLFATSTLCLACMQSLLFGLQHYKLKHPTQSRLLKLLPPLQTMESLLFRFVWLGVLCLSLALISGLMFQLQHPELGHQPEIILSFVAWFVLVGLLLGRYMLGWRAQTAVLGTTSGFALIFTSYFGAKFFL